MHRIKELSKYLILLLLFSTVTKSSENIFSSRFFYDWNKKGLAERTIWEIDRDKRGQIWLATNKGLYFYDAYQFTLIQSAQPTLTNSIVRSFEILENGTTWLGTYDGLAELKPNSSHYEKIILMTREGERLNFKIYKVSHSKNKLWLSTSNGLYVFDIKTKYTEKMSIIPNEDIEKKINDILHINNITFIAYENRLISFNERGELLEEYTIKAISNEYVQLNKLFLTKSNNLLIGSTDGLYKFDLIKKHLDKIQLMKNHLNIISIEESTKNEFFIGTLFDGLFKLRNNKISRHYYYQKSNHSSLSDNDIYSLFYENDILWIGTFNGGLNQYNLNAEQYSMLNEKIDSISCLDTPVIYASIVTNDSLFLATQNGLVSFDLKNKHCTSFREKLNKTEIISLFLKNEHTLLLGSGKGIMELNLKDNSVKSKSPELKNKYIYSMFKDSNSNLWVGTQSGIYVKKASSLQFEKIKSSTKKLENAWIFKILQSKSGRIIASSWVGLLEVEDSKSNQLTDNAFDMTIDTPVRAFTIDNDDIVWFGLDYKGLYSATLEGKLEKRYTDSKIVNNISGFLDVYSDQYHNVWVAGKSGIDVINIKTNKIYNLKDSDGLQSDIFTINSIYKTNDSRLIFNGRKGLNIINPKTFSPNLRVPDIIINKFNFLNHNNNKIELSTRLDLKSTNQHLLEYSDRDIEIQFSALDFEAPFRNQYAYKMLGWNEDWNFTNSDNRRASYTNLPAGNYTFIVKGSNNHGVWSDEPATLQIKVSSAPWLTWWAYTIYGILTILLIFTFIKYRTNALKKRSIELENSVKQRTNELATEKSKVEQLLAHKNEEFANVSHELRTPLTLILGPLAQVIESKQKDVNLNRLNIIQRNSYRLLRMVDQLLNLETFRVKAITQRGPQAVSKIISLLAEAFIDLANQKQIELTIKEITPINFEFTNDGIEKIILNLLSNAIKYSKAGDTISLNAYRGMNNEYIITVKDTGIGISKDKLTKIFERYNRVLDENSEQITGAGIGLALVKSIVESHDGRVDVQSELGKGSCFEVTLPVINEIENVKANNHTNQEIIAMELMSLTHQEAKLSESDPGATIEPDGKPILLIIEDNLDMRNFIGDNLNSIYQVILAKDGAQGVARAIDQVPDLIISDIMMPKIDGYQTTRLLRENDITNHIPIILLTARGDRVSRLKGWQEKADEYITKPFDIEELKIRILNLLAIRNILKRRFSENLFNQETVINVQKNEKQSSSISENNNSIPELNTIQQNFVKKLNDYIELHYFESDFSTIVMSNNLAMSERQLFRKLRSILDMTPAEYLRRFRLEKAKSKLSEGYNISYVSSEVGFSSQSYFGKCFKAQYGLTPKEFQKQNQL